MSKFHFMLSIAAVLLLVAIQPGTAEASTVSVPVTNADFEADQLPFPGADQPTITGWDTSPGGGDGIFRPTAGDYPGGIPSGENVAYVNLPGNRVAQVLTTVLEANTRYVLEVEVGWNENDPFAGYVVQLRAGGVVLAQDASSQTPAQGSFVTSTVVFTAGLGHPQLGQPLEIRLLAPGVQANFDDVRLTATAVGVCAEMLLVPAFLADTVAAAGTNALFAVRNLTGGTVVADVEYFTEGGTSQRLDSVVLGPHQVETVSVRDVPGLAVDVDGFARGFVRILTAGSADRSPVLAGDFFQVDAGNDFATGERLVRQSDLCSEASIRLVDFGAGTRFTVFVTQPRGNVPASDPPSFTVQVHDEDGIPVGGLQPFWTAGNSFELAGSDITSIAFGSVTFDFTNSLGGTVYAEYSAQGRFSVGVASQCAGAPSCDATDCCPPGSRKAIAGGIHYPQNDFPDCAAAISDALRSLDSFHYRNACQIAYGGALPAAVLGARVVDCQVSPPNVVVAVEVCCPAP